jgi:hypothetical protein
VDVPCLCREVIPFALRLALQGQVVFDDAAVHHGNVAVAVKVGRAFSLVRASSVAQYVCPMPQVPATEFIRPASSKLRSFPVARCPIHLSSPDHHTGPNLDRCSHRAQRGAPGGTGWDEQYVLRLQLNGFRLVLKPETHRRGP